MKWQAVTGWPSAVVAPASRVQIRSRHTGSCAWSGGRAPRQVYVTGWG
jgi:hypothetical protein